MLGIAINNEKWANGFLEGLYLLNNTEVFKKLETLVRKYGDHFGTDQSEIDIVLNAVRANDLASLEDAQKFLVWDAIGRNDANIDRSELDFMYERLGQVVFPQAHKK